MPYYLNEFDDISISYTGDDPASPDVLPPSDDNDFLTLSPPSFASMLSEVMPSSCSFASNASKQSNIPLIPSLYLDEFCQMMDSSDEDDDTVPLRRKESFGNRTIVQQGSVGFSNTSLRVGEELSEVSSFRIHSGNVWRIPIEDVHERRESNKRRRVLQ